MSEQDWIGAENLNGGRLLRVGWSLKVDAGSLVPALVARRRYTTKKAEAALREWIEKHGTEYVEDMICRFLDSHEMGAMNYERVTREGKREIRADDVIYYDVPHDHEIAPAALFPVVAREAFMAQFSADGGGQSFMRGKEHLAAAYDLRALKERLTPDVSPILDQAINALIQTAAQSTSPAGLAAMKDQLAKLATVQVEPTVGLEADDERWCQGAVRRRFGFRVEVRAATDAERAAHQKPNCNGGIPT